MKHILFETKLLTNVQLGHYTITKFYSDGTQETSISPEGPVVIHPIPWDQNWEGFLRSSGSIPVARDSEVGVTSATPQGEPPSAYTDHILQALLHIGVVVSIWFIICWIMK